jgi:hypothetical protein
MNNRRRKHKSPKPSTRLLVGIGILLPLDARAGLRSLVLSQYSHAILQHHQTHRRATVCQMKKTLRSSGGISYEDENIVQSANGEANGRIHP